MQPRPEEAKLICTNNTIIRRSIGIHTVNVCTYTILITDFASFRKCPNDFGNDLASWPIYLYSKPLCTDSRPTRRPILGTHCHKRDFVTVIKVMWVIERKIDRQTLHQADEHSYGRMANDNIVKQKMKKRITLLLKIIKRNCEWSLKTNSERYSELNRC